MEYKTLFTKFNEGKLILPKREVCFSEIPWSKHASFEGVELKHIVTSKDTNGQFSYHLVHISANKKIGIHIHENQLETHEVISGTGICINDNIKIEYIPGTITIFPIGVEHEVSANDNDLYIFAKFFPALC